MATNNQRGYTAGRFAMDLGGSFAGWISSIEGGHATSDVVVEKLGADMIQHKHMAGVKYEDISVSCGTGMSKAFYTWIQARSTASTRGTTARSSRPTTTEGSRAGSTSSKR